MDNNIPESSQLYENQNMVDDDDILESENSTENIQIHNHMSSALSVAKALLHKNEVPVGCFFIYNGNVIASGGNTVNETRNATRHAEMNCIDQVLDWCKKNQKDHVNVFKDIEVVVTVEPCIMCAAAMHQLNIKKIVFGCSNDRFGGCSSVLNTAEIYNSSCKISSGLFKDEAMALLKQFYKGTNPNAPESKVKKK